MSKAKKQPRDKAVWWFEDGSPGWAWFTFAVFYYFILFTILFFWFVTS